MHETAEQYRLLAIGARAMAIRSAPPQSGVYREEAAAYERMAELAERKGQPKEETARCETCMFYRSVSYKHFELGNCHRYPPTQSDGQVLGTTWCGEWKPKS